MSAYSLPVEGNRVDIDKLSGLVDWDHLTPIEEVILCGDVSDPQGLLDAVERNPEVARYVWSRNRTVLHYAANTGYVPLVRRLIELGSDVNVYDPVCGTPLHCAQFDPELLSLLLTHGAEVNLPDPSGRTIMFNARLSHYEPAIELLDRFGARG